MPTGLETDYTFVQRLLLPAKRAAQRLPTGRDTIVVASFGRAGSTLVYKALNEGMARARFGTDAYVARKVVRDYAFDLTTCPMRPGVVYKSHDYPENLAQSDGVRAVFLFGSTVDAALSAYTQKDQLGEAWIRQHFQHLRRPYRYDELLVEDVLGFRDQCLSWMGFEGCPVLCMRYEGLWDNANLLSEFTGLDIRMPKRRARSEKDVSPELVALAEESYGPLDAALARLPDAFVAQPKYAALLNDPQVSPGKGKPQ